MSLDHWLPPWKDTLYDIPNILQRYPRIPCDSLVVRSGLHHSPKFCQQRDRHRDMYVDISLWDCKRCIPRDKTIPATTFKLNPRTNGASLTYLESTTSITIACIYKNSITVFLKILRNISLSEDTAPTISTKNNKQTSKQNCIPELI